MRTRHHFLPIEQAQVGMQLCEPLQIAEHGLLSMTLPAGHTLTQENLAQLTAHHAEFLDVLLPDMRSEEQVAVDAALAARRTMAIFEGTDLTEPTMAAFFDQVLAYRSA